MRSLSPLLSITPLLAACASVDVRTDHDPSVDFSRYSTYFWKHAPVTTNPLMNGRIVAAVDAELGAKGWRRVSEDRAETALAADVTTQERQRVDTVHADWGRSWHGWGYGGPVRTTTRVVTYQVGTVVLDLYDRGTKNAIWRGTASGIVAMNPETLRRSIDEGARRMFESFPPRRP